MLSSHGKPEFYCLEKQKILVHPYIINSSEAPRGLPRGASLKALHIAPIPNPGEAFRNVFAACIAIAGSDQQIFKLLLDTILHDEYNTGKTFLMVGLMEGDPLLLALRKYLHIPIRTCIYAWAWDRLDAVNQLDGRLPYLELGGL
jgi:hypothetical protein